MLSFEIRETANENAIQIHYDEAGLRLLINAINKTQEQGHVHLRSPSAGGKDLRDLTIHGKKAVGEVIITFSPE
jgi:hypothetical protein